MQTIFSPSPSNACCAYLFVHYYRN